MAFSSRLLSKSKQVLKNPLISFRMPPYFGREATLPVNMTRYNLKSFSITLYELTPGLQEKLPPSDSRLRPDQRHLENGEYEKANYEKLRLEKRQRMIGVNHSGWGNQTRFRDRLLVRHGVTPWTPMKGLLIQDYEHGRKGPAFKEGGLLWFQDLSTPDSLYIHPVMAGLAFLIQVEKVMRGLAFLTVPFTMNFPKAVFFYWITNNCFSLVYGTIIKRPEVKKYLRIPEIPKPPPGSTPTAAFSLSDAYKNYKDMFQKHAPAPVASTEAPPKLLMEKPKLLVYKPAAAAALNQQIVALESTVR